MITESHPLFLSPPYSNTAYVMRCFFCLCAVSVTTDGGGVDDVEAPNGIACSRETTDEALCKEQFQNSAVAALKVEPNPGYRFNGWIVNGAHITLISAEPLLLTTMPMLAQNGGGYIPTTNPATVEGDCPIQPSVEIVSADVTQNQIQVRLSPADAAGALTLELRDPDTHVILEAQARTGSADIQNETFDLDNWSDEAIGQYTRLRATWTVGTLEAQTELVFPDGMRLDVLDGYTHTQYQAISEQDFTDNPIDACLVLGNQCTYQQITLRSDFLHEVINNTGHGMSLNHGRLQWGAWCADNGYPPPSACAPTGERVRTFVVVDTYQGSCGSPVIPETTVAVGLNRNTLAPQNPDDLRCGERIFIYQPDYPELRVIKTVTDRCPACAGERHVDNYVDESVEAFTYPGSPMTLRLY